MRTVAVVGTAGRQGQPLSSATLDRMVSAVEAQIAAWGLRLCDVRLVSGGSAWADHAAVLVFLRHPECELLLHMPCAFRGRFVDHGPGRLLNKYHQLQSSLTGVDSLAQIAEALERGARVTCSDGFHARNSLVAQSQFMVAMTFGHRVPDTPGTLDTWRKCRGVRVHVSLL